MFQYHQQQESQIAENITDTPTDGKHFATSSMVSTNLQFFILQLSQNDVAYAFHQFLFVSFHIRCLLDVLPGACGTRDSRCNEEDIS